MCRSLKIPVTQAANKHDLVQLISRKRGDADPTPPTPYSGRLVDIPNTISGISSLSVAKLILYYHQFPIAGNKDQLALRIYLLRQGETAAIVAREEKQLKDLIEVYKCLSFAQRKLQLCAHTYQRRTFTTKRYHNLVAPPDDISGENLHELFEPITNVLETQRQSRQECDQRNTTSLLQPKDRKHLFLKEKICQVGAKVKIQWKAEELYRGFGLESRVVCSFCAELQRRN